MPSLIKRHISYIRSHNTSQAAVDVSKFAPKHTIENNFSENSECPICFLNYEALNEATCCKQLICTGCYLLMKYTATLVEIKCPCPFCSNETLNIVYHPQLNVISKLCEKGSPVIQDTAKTSGSESFVSSPSGSNCSKSDDYDVTFNTEEVSTSGYRKKVPNDIIVPICSINDRNDIENEIQKQRMKYTDDRPSPGSSSARTRAGDAYMESLNQSFARRNYNVNNNNNYNNHNYSNNNNNYINNNINADYNNSRGTMSDFEQAALRLRFAVAIGERSGERLSQRLMMPNLTENPNAIPTAGRSLSPSMMRSREQIAVNEYFEGRSIGKRSNNDLERIEEMMMMEVSRMVSYRIKLKLF